MIDKYELFNDIMERKSSRCGFWHGNPHPDSYANLFKYFGVKSDFELGVKLGDTFMWVADGWGEYKHPENEPLFDLYKNRGIPHLSELTDDDTDLVGKLNWPDAEYYDFSGFKRAKALAKELGPSNIRVNAIASGAIDTDMNKETTTEEWEELKIAEAVKT